MIYRRPLVLVQVLVAILAFTPVSFGGNKKKQPAPKATATPPPLLEVTGGILGVKLFAPLEEARENLAHFKLEKDSTAAGAEPEGDGGERMVWRLAETEYLWIVAWTDKEGKVVKISASVRPEKKKPFGEIGDLGRAKMHNDSMAMWIVRRPDGSSYRLVAKGPAEHALSIYMYSLESEGID